MQIEIRKREKFRHWDIVVETLNISLGLAAVFLGIFIFCNLSSMIEWLPLMFLTAALANLISAMKKFYYHKRLQGFGLLIISVFIFLFAVVSYITLWL